MSQAPTVLLVYTVRRRQPPVPRKGAIDRSHMLHNWPRTCLEQSSGAESSSTTMSDPIQAAAAALGLPAKGTEAPPLVCIPIASDSLSRHDRSLIYEVEKNMSINDPPAFPTRARTPSTPTGTSDVHSRNCLPLMRSHVLMQAMQELPIHLLPQAITAVYRGVFDGACPTYAISCVPHAGAGTGTPPSTRKKNQRKQPNLAEKKSGSSFHLDFGLSNFIRIKTELANYYKMTELKNLRGLLRLRQQKILANFNMEFF